ncbi:transcription factor MYB106 [Sorghum bicolor]|nr:transcription factor MYB106 [Sorghum bicolor]OQU80505.1 hypothetical protein SORBI_3007G136500 [Sorghum bicolor]|eukprot:XP_002444392.1 transcription factor MYB106 [Sorghum bicolor]
MGRSPCCEKIGLKKGPWTPEEDQKLLAFIEEHGHGSWRALPAKAGLQRCGKSCRLRWTNYLRPDIKRGKFSLQEEQTIIQLHALLGNRWSAIATHLPNRTDNEIKNYWNTHLKKRLAKMGIDPVTHKSLSGTLTGTTNNKSAKAAASLSHMAQWESARLEAEARLARESKIRTATPTPTALHAQPTNVPASAASPCLDVLHGWQGAKIDLESPTSTLTFTGSNSGMLPTPRTNRLEVSESNSVMWHQRSDELEGEENDWQIFSKHQVLELDSKEREDDFIGCEEPWFSGMAGVGSGFTSMLFDVSNEHDASECWGESNNGHTEHSNQASDEEDKNYWNGVLDMVNSELTPQSPPLV